METENLTDLSQEKYWDKYNERWLFYPHGIIRPRPELNGSECWYCGQILPWDVDKDGMINIRPFGCVERHPPCKWCGEEPECAPDCVGIRMALSDPDVYVAGGDPF